MDGEVKPQIESVERPVRPFSPVSEVSGELSKIFVNLRSSDSALVDSELAIVQAITTEVPDVEVVLGVGTDRDDFDVSLGKYPSQVAKIQHKLQELGLQHARMIPRPKKSRPAWARDMGFWANDGRVFVVPGESPAKRGLHSAGISQLPAEETEKLCTALQIDEVAASSYPFEGGDAVFTDEASYFGHSAVRSDADREALEKVVNSSVRVLGSEDTSSPFPHLDSGVVFATNDIALINDPDALFNILTSLSDSELMEWQGKFERKMRGRERRGGAVKSTADISAEIIRDIGFISSPGKYGHDVIRGGLEREIKMMEAIKKQLLADGKDFIEIPGMTMMGFPFSPVNSLIDTWSENGATKRRLFLPTYGLPRLDEEVQGKLQYSGVFSKIVPVEVGWELNLSRGGIRCVVNGLRK